MVSATEYRRGDAVLRYEEELATCRFYGADAAAGEKPPYHAVCSIARWASHICEIRGFKGKVSKNHVRCLVQALLERGFSLAYLERPDGQGLDLIAERIVGGDFDGWYRMDIAALARRLRMV